MTKAFNFNSILGAISVAMTTFALKEIYENSKQLAVVVAKTAMQAEVVDRVEKLCADTHDGQLELKQRVISLENRLR